MQFAKGLPPMTLYQQTKKNAALTSEVRVKSLASPHSGSTAVRTTLAGPASKRWLAFHANVSLHLNRIFREVSHAVGVELYSAIEKGVEVEHQHISNILSKELGQGATAPSPHTLYICLLYTSPSPRDKRQSRMPSSA